MADLTVILPTGDRRVPDRRRVVALVSCIALLIGLGSGAAYGYWSTSGSGSGTASAGAPAGVTIVAASGTPSTLLIPGTSAGLIVTLDNPNGYPVTITGISQNGSVSPVGGSGSPACSASNAGVSVPTLTGLTVPVASGSGVTIDLPAGVTMSTTSASGCQGASFQIPVTLTVQK